MKDRSQNGSTPHSEDSELGLLCSLLLAPEKAAKECALRLPEDAVLHPAYKDLLGVLTADGNKKRDKEGRVDFFWLADTLKNRGLLNVIGGKQFLNTLYNFIPTDNAGYYIESILEKYQLRELLSATEDILKQCKEPTADPKLILADAEQKIGKILHINNGSGLPIESGTELLGADLPLPPELIVGLLHKTLKGQLAGSSKSMKSWALIQLAVAVSLGQDWWGFKTTPGRVLFINLEIPRAFFRQRVRDIVGAMQVTLNPETFSVMHLRGADLSKPEAWDRMMTAITRSGPWDLLVFDPVYKILGKREENSATDVTQIVMSLERSRVNRSCGCVQPSLRKRIGSIQRVD